VPSGPLTLTALKIRRGAKAKVEALLNIVNDLEIATDARLVALDRLLASTVRLASRSSLEAVDIAAATSFQMNDNSVVAHPPTTGLVIRKLLLNAGSLSIDATSRIDVAGRGFLGGGQPGNPSSTNGMTLGFQAVNGAGTAGSYGGLGGAFSGTTNPVYGDFRNPNDVGSGGGGFNGNRAGNGGGLVRIVAQAVILNGVVTANGGAPASDGFAAGGSGGGIRIDAGVLSGTGSITARGSSSTPSGGGGGGGGRIAVYYQSAASFSMANVVAAGGSGSGAPNGQNGTIHLQQQLAMLVPSFQNNPTKFAQLVKPEEGGIQQGRTLGTDVIADARKSKILTPVAIATANIDSTAPEAPEHRDTSLLRLSTRNVERDNAPNSLNLPMVTEHRLLASLPNMALDDLDPIYTYDLNGNRIAMIDPTGLTSYSYDASNRLISITNNKGQKTEFTYDVLGRRTSLTHANGVITNYTYDATSQLTRLSHQLGTTTINSFDYTYDRVGNRKSKADRHGSYNYAYDALNRLSQASNPLPANPLESFTYDPVGNRTNSNQNGSSSFNEANELLEDGSFTYEYDANGNMIRKAAKVGGVIVTYDYDAENRLVRVVSSTGTISNYKYDGIGRRVEKEVIGAQTAVTRYLYDNEDVLLELNSSNAVTARYTHGPGVDEPLIMEKNGQSFFYHRDGLSSVTDISSQAGAVVQHYAYSSFGQIESMLDSSFNQPYTFTARELDPETGLYFYRARYYEPSIGRFLQPDPIGLAAGPNAYTYAGNMPATFVDPLGLDYVDVAANYAAGMGDAMSFGITNYIRDRMGTNSVIDQCSWSYSAGWWTGMAQQMAFSGAGAFHGGARTVLYSGEGALDAARAAKGAGRLLEDTMGGQLLKLIDRNIVTVPDIAWRAVSAVFAGNAKGEVVVVLRNPNLQSVYNTVEVPVLKFVNSINSTSKATRVVVR
jgi:RHS repeat-associated protein